MKCALLVSLATIVIPLATVQAQDTLLWRYTTTEKITFYQLTSLGDLLVATKEQVVVLDPKTGDVRWARTDILKPPSGIISNPGPFPTAAFSPIPLTSSGVFRTKDGMAVVDLVSGETLWDSTAVPLKKVRGHIAVPQHHMVLVYGETPESKRTLVGVDIGTGEVRWRQDTLFRKSPKIEKVNSIRFLAGQGPVVDSDSTFILWLSKDGPMKLHARSGEVLWRSPFRKNPPLLSEGYAPMIYRNGVLYAPYKKKVVAFNTEDGSVIWERRRKFRNPVVQMEVTDRGLVVRGRMPDEAGRRPDDPPGPRKDFFVDVVNLTNGESLWEVDFRQFFVPTPFVVFGEYVYYVWGPWPHAGLPSGWRLIALGLADGTAVDLGNFKVKYGETPEMLQLVGDNLLISWPKNYVVIDRNGTILGHRHYDAPGRSLLERLFEPGPGFLLDSITGTVFVKEGDKEIYPLAFPW